MKNSDDTKKELVVAGAGAVAIVAGAPALIALAIPALLGLTFTRIRKRDERRAAKIVDWMVLEEESPERFIEELRQRLEDEDEDTLTAFRVLVSAAVEAITPNALAPLAFIGRRYLRAECPAWIARGALETLQRVDSAEFQALSRLLVEIEPIKSDAITITADLQSEKRWRAYQRSVPDDKHPITPFAGARRVFGYLKRAGLGTDTSAYGIGGSAEVVEIERVAADSLREAMCWPRASGA